jgi:hypothetical protein
MDEAARKELARRYLDAAESWMRQLIRQKLAPQFGPDFFQARWPDGSNVINNGIRKHVADRKAADPARFSDDIAAIEFGHAVTILLHPRLFADHFRSALLSAFPDGRDEAYTFLSRLEAHRNRLAHGGVCSERMLQQCACYSNDLIDSLKAHYVETSLDKVFNVPTFTRVVDNLGNERHFTGPSPNGLQYIDFRDGAHGDLKVGDTLIVDVEVDQTFQDYTVRWMTFSNPSDRGTGIQWQLPIALKHVGAQIIIRAEVASNEAWHKLDGECDDRMDLRYRVLPPPR